MSQLETILSSPRALLTLDGAMGTMIQQHGIIGANNDMLVVEKPELIASIHRAYLEAGADLIETCSFGAQRISQAEYGTANRIREINLAAARIARAEVDRMNAITPTKPRFVLGSIGPTGKTASMSADISSPESRPIDFDTLVAAFQEQIEALLEGGVDALLIETTFDTLNVKCAIEAARLAFASQGKALPIMLSITIDASGRMLAGQSIEAFVTSISSHFFCPSEQGHIVSVGLNCSFGAEQMAPYLQRLSDICPVAVSAYPNAGFPDAEGRYDQSPDDMMQSIGKFLDNRIVNIVGGCCGTTPEYIRLIAQRVDSLRADQTYTPRQPHCHDLPFLSGLDPFTPRGFVNVGERCNVAGSRKFLTLIKEHRYDEALAIARRQVEDGAQVLDINMDDGMLDAREEMQRFIRLMAADTTIARVPWMIDSSDFSVIETALKNCQGKCIVNSLSLKEGEEHFLRCAERVRQFGAALVVMAFDEQGQATTLDRKKEVCARAYRLLRERIDFPASDIIFDPNILAIGTGIAAHARYAVDFIDACHWIHNELPSAKVSGGVSNLSFAFRGNTPLREAIHAVFLYHAIEAGLDMAIVNPATKVSYSDIQPSLLEAIEDLIFARREDATERVLSEATKIVENHSTQDSNIVDRSLIPITDRLKAALRSGDTQYLTADLAEALNTLSSPSAIVEGPLMEGMQEVGRLFGEGKIFLPQVVKSARTMKQAVEFLTPYIEASATSTHDVNHPKYLIATVKGDVHDIGKNIAAVVLACNGFEVIDLGVMVDADRIAAEAKHNSVDFIALSGLITPSLEEMRHTAKVLHEAGVNVPLFISGATTSPLHTALRIAPEYGGEVFHIRDAAQNPIVAMQLMGAERERAIACNRFEQERLRQLHVQRSNSELSPSTLIEHRHHASFNMPIARPSYLGQRVFNGVLVEEVVPYISWLYFYHLWGVKEDSVEGKSLRRDAEAMLARFGKTQTMQAVVGFYEANGTDDSIVAYRCRECGDTIAIATPRQHKLNENGEALALCDFVAPAPSTDYIGVFAATLSEEFAAEIERIKTGGDRYEALLAQSLADRLAEAMSEYIHMRVRRKEWGYAPQENIAIHQMLCSRFQGIRPAVGYPSLPDQRTIFTLGRLIDFSAIGIQLTENGAMLPQASVAGIYIAHPEAKYFSI